MHHMNAGMMAQALEQYKILFIVINRPCVPGAVLQTVSLIIQNLPHDHPPDSLKPGPAILKAKKLKLGQNVLSPRLKF